MPYSARSCSRPASSPSNSTKSRYFYGTSRREKHFSVTKRQPFCSCTGSSISPLSSLSPFAFSFCLSSLFSLLHTFCLQIWVFFLQSCYSVQSTVTATIVSILVTLQCFLLLSKPFQVDRKLVVQPVREERLSLSVSVNVRVS